MLESFAIATIAAVIKKGFSLVGMKLMANALTIWSTFDIVSSVHQLIDIPGCLVKLSYSAVSDHAVSVLVDEVVDNRYDISQTPSGLYVASHKPILSPGIVLPTISEWYSGGFSGEFAQQWANRSSEHASDLEQRRSQFLDELNRRRR